MIPSSDAPSDKADPYADGTATYWHLSGPSPELVEAVKAGWLRPGMRVLDLGCGLASDIAFLHDEGFVTAGVDLSDVALRRARALHPQVTVVSADVRQLPFASASFDYLLDRGCFHYLPADDRLAYVTEAARVLRPGGELLLRACLHAQGVRNDITERTIEDAFAGWRIELLESRWIPSDTREMEALVVRLVRR